MYIITNSNNKFLGLKLDNNFNIEENDVIIEHFDNNEVYIGIDPINSDNYFNLLNFTNLSFKEIYKELNPHKKFMEQKKNKARRIKSIYNLIKQIIELNKYNLKNYLSEKLIQKNEIDSDDIPLTNELIKENLIESCDNKDVSESECTESNDNQHTSESESDENQDVSEINSDIFVKNDKNKILDKPGLDNLVILSKSGFLIYSTVVFLAGMSFEFYFSKFKR